MKRILLLVAAVLTTAIASIGLWTGSLAVGAATASADGPGGDAPGNPDHKVWICHVPPGNDENPRIIFVDESGWNGHYSHTDDKGPFASEGDASGACPAGPPTTEPPTTTTTVVGL